MKMTSTEHKVTATILEEGTNSGNKGFDRFVCSKEETIYKGNLTWMYDTRIRLVIQMELLTCKDEPD